MNFLNSLLDTSLAIWVQSSDYGYYILLVGHAIGMALVVGTVVVLCLRVLGFSSEQPLAQFAPLFRIAWAGFAVNLLTGLALFTANGPNLVQDPPFDIKISFILIGGVCLQLLWRKLRREGVVGDVAVGDVGAVPSASARVLACFTLACWLTAIMAGRLIAYTISY